MANEFFEPGEQRTAKVQALFARIAPKYDLLNDLQSFGLHRYWKRRLLQLALPQPAERALDLCCGTGDLALALAARGLEVIGLDFSERMLEMALKRLPIRNSERNERRPGTLHFVQGDAQRLPFGNATFDLVTVGYGLRNLADWQAGLVEMARVSKPGGRLLVLDLGKPDNALWRSLYFRYLSVVVPLLGRCFAGSAGAYGYILESLKHYPAQHGVAAEMKRSGMNRVRIVNLLGGVMSINYGEKPGGSCS